MLFQTDRLLVRAFGPNDLENLFQVYGDPVVMQLIREPLTWVATREMLDQQIQGYGQNPAYGRFAVQEKLTGGFCGIFLIHFTELTGGIEIGYAFLPQFWSRGFATELTLGALEYAFGTLGLERVFAITDLQNLASQMVLLKAGFEQLPELKEKSKPVAVFCRNATPANRIRIEEGLDLEKIGPGKSLLLQQTAIRAYRDHYLHLWDDLGQWYLEYSFSRPVLEKEISQPWNHFFLVRYQEKIVGFVKINQESSPEQELSAPAMELERIYLYALAAGKGLGTRIMQWLFRFSKDSGKELLWLKTMDSSREAISFYQKMGFNALGTHRLNFERMKPEYRGMLILGKRLV
jgi:diamine N-acetyltransferase